MINTLHASSLELPYYYCCSVTTDNVGKFAESLHLRLVVFPYKEWSVTSKDCELNLEASIYAINVEKSG